MIKIKIFTTYFAKLKKLPEDIIPIAICGKSPDWYKGLEYKKLAPKYDFFMKWKQDHDNNAYIKCFKEQVLGGLLPEAIRQEFSVLSGGKDVALICYEKPLDFCHRHIVSRWFTIHNILSVEWKEGVDYSDWC